MKKFNKKHLIPFILFIFLCMLIYTKYGMINVKASQLDCTNYLPETFMRNFYYSQGSTFNTYQNGYNGNFSSSTSSYHYYLYYSSDWQKGNVTPNRFGFSLRNANSYLSNYFSENSIRYVNIVLHFRLYYDIRNENYWNPYRELYNNMIGGSSVSEGSSGSSHGGSGVSFDPETSGDHSISGEEKFYRLSFLNEDLELYNLTWGFTSDDDSTFVDIYAWYQGSINLTVPISYDNNGYDIEYHVPYENFENNTASDIVDYFGYLPNTESTRNSYMEYKQIILSDTNQYLSLSDYYDEDSCLSTGNCGSSYSTEDNSLLGRINKSISDFLNSIVNALKNLFIPQEGFLDSVFSDTKDLFEQKFGILIFPAQVFTNLANRFISLSDTDVNNFVLNIPDILIPGFDIPIISSQSYNLGDVLNYGSIKILWTIYLDFIDCFMIISVLNLCWNKLNSIIGGQIVDTEYYTVSESETFDTVTGERLYGRTNYTDRKSKWRSRRI